MGHTDVPETFRGFLKQRLRWDGDLSYLYLRKYRHHLRPGLMGLRNFLALVWTGLLFQLALPFVLLTYTIYMLFVYPAAVTLGDRKSTRLNSSHLVISYAVFCLKKKNNHISKTLINIQCA